MFSSMLSLNRGGGGIAVTQVVLTEAQLLKHCPHLQSVVTYLFVMEMSSLD